VRWQAKSKAKSLGLIFFKAAGVVALTNKDAVGCIFRWFYLNSVVIPTKTLKVLEN